MATTQTPIDRFNEALKSLDEQLQGVRDQFDERRKEFERNTEGLAAWITTIRKRSDEVADSDLPDSIQLLFIDGDHSYEQASRDVERFASRVAGDGIMVFHDSNAWAGVSRTIGETLQTGRWVVVGQVHSLLWMRRAVWAAEQLASETWLTDGGELERAPDVCAWGS